MKLALLGTCTQARIFSCRTTSYGRIRCRKERHSRRDKEEMQ